MIRGPIDGKYVELWGIPAWRRKLGIGDESETLTQRIENIIAGTANGGPDSGPGSVDNANARLAAFATFEEAGYVVQTSTFPPAFAGRQIIGVPNRINVTHGTGINGNTLLQTPQDIHEGATPSFQTIKPLLLNPDFVTYVDSAGELASTTITATQLETAVSSASAMDILTTLGDLLTHDGTAYVRFPIGTNDQFLRVNGTNINWETISAASFPHTVLDTTVHTDTLTGTVVRGDIIYGNSTPLWARLAKGAANTVLRANATDVVWGQVVLTTDVTGTLPVLNGGTNATSWTAGSVIFAGAGGTALAQDNAGLFYDNATNRLGIDTVTPIAQLQVDDEVMAGNPTSIRVLFNSEIGVANGAGQYETLVLSNGGTNPGTAIMGSSLSFKAPTFGLTTSFSSGRILSYFDTSGGSNPGFAGSLLALQYPTGDNVFVTGLVLRNGRVGIANTAPGVLFDLGLAGTTLGVMRLAGSTSGNVTIQPQAIAGTWTLQLPQNDGAANEFLRTDGGGITSWAAATPTYAFTEGSVIFAGAGGTSLAEDNANLFWDNALNYLRVGAATSLNSTITALTASVRTTSTFCYYLTATDTSVTAGIAKYGLYINTSGAWSSGAGSEVYGVLSLANGSSLSNIGGHFEAEGSAPTSYGVRGIGDATGNQSIGVYGASENVSATNNYGGWFQASGATNNYAILCNGGKIYNNSRAGIICANAALATNATAGFLYIPTCAGAPTGVPDAETGTAALVFDTTNDTLYVYRGGWKGVVVV